MSRAVMFAVGTRSTRGDTSGSSTGPSSISVRTRTARRRGAVVGSMVGASVVWLSLVNTACTPTASPGASRDVAARSPHVHLPGNFRANHDDGRAAETAPRSIEARPIPLATAPTSGLPFRLHVSASDASAPVLPRTNARLASNCVSVAPRTSGEPVRYEVHFEGTFAAAGYSLRARLDGHTSRSLVLARKGHTVLPLEQLSNEWVPVTAGDHELVVFVRDRRGVVPVDSDGNLVFDRCRFTISEAGSVVVRPPPAEGLLLLSPEGTLHGDDAHSTLLQVAGNSPSGRGDLQIERPDGGFEVHELDLAGSAISSRNVRFDVAGLQNGDYAFSVRSISPRDHRQASQGSTQSVHRISVNREASIAD